MTYPSVIGVAGEFGHGKDSVGKFLVEDFGYSRRAFGDYLKLEVQNTLAGIKGRSLYLEDLAHLGCPKECLDAIRACIVLGDMDPFKKPTSPEMRSLLQLYGTEFRRVQMADYWVRSLDYDRPLPEKLVITDVRFQNEVDYVRSLGGVCCRVIRPGFNYYGAGTHTAHQSERDIDAIAFDAYIYNDIDVPGLNAAVHEVMSAFNRTRNKPIIVRASDCVQNGKALLQKRMEDLEAAFANSDRLGFVSDAVL